MNYEEAKVKLKKYGQLHVLDHFEELTDTEKNELLTQIDETDFSIIRYAENPHGGQKRGKITPLGAMEISQIEEIPTSVSINEAVKLAKKYGTENSGSYINGVLSSFEKSL